MWQKRFNPNPVILVSDPNSDPDDLVSYLILKQLVTEQKIDLKAVITTLGDLQTRQRRTKFAAAVWQILGIMAPVICGADYPGMGKLNSHYCENEWADKLEKLGNPSPFGIQNVIMHTLHQSRANSVIILINAQMNDIADFLNEERQRLLFKQKVARVVLMGACGEKQNGIYPPSLNSFNNKVCPEGAEKLFDFLQKNKIPLVLVPKETVYQARVCKDFYERLKNIDNLISKVLYSTSRQCMENLWNEIKSGRVAHFDLKRYVKVFMGSDYPLRQGGITLHSNFDEVWEKVRYFSLYDAIAALVVSKDDFKEGGIYEKLPGKNEVYLAKITDADIIRDKLYRMCEKSLTEIIEK